MSSPRENLDFLNSFITSFVKKGLNKAGPMMTPQLAAFISTILGGCVNTSAINPSDSPVNNIKASVNNLKMLSTLSRSLIEPIAEDVSKAVKKTVDLGLSSDLDFFMNILSLITSPYLVNYKRSISLILLGIDPSVLKDLRTSVTAMNLSIKPILMGVYDVAVDAAADAKGPGASGASGASGAASGSVTSGPVFSLKGGYRKTKAKRSKKGKTQRR